MKIAFSEISMPKRGSLAVGVYAGSKLSASAESADEASGGQIRRAIAASRFTGARRQWLEIFAPSGLDVRTVFLFGLGDEGKLDELTLEAVGGELVRRANAAGETGVTVLLDDLDNPDVKPGEGAARIAYGAVLGAYRFDRYRTRESDDKKPTLTRVTVASKSSASARRRFGALEMIADGVKLTRDLVSEPANKLYPESFAAQCEELRSLGVDVEVLDEAAMRSLGMHALLGVGQGSARESRLVVMQWKGSHRKNAAPLAFVGKGVCFDTGGISLKPAPGMEEMKWDMGGAGTVTGLMKALAGRKAKIDAVGVVGLVENMPDGNAQRPGDVVTSMSGQTIEILNTDAEGRLVLADALWYTQDRFKPELMIDLATLTGAIIITLGAEKAGLFSNDDTLADRLLAAGKAEDEGLWRLPVGEPYDKTLESPIADMGNISANGRGAGSIVAAEFLRRFVNDVPWAHLDIAGVAWSKKDKPTVPKGGTGFGVRLLDRFVQDNYEA
ncbi:leucyl aminopeptidase [Oceanibacterium hippocampi]|uniref:Probable cytosol aminopeptidase n=1 Tax=Oceanibacterium hippocampi TaxID=745714 RepID=A0A1Y5SZ48_9PROT|nr:leucyl aminopeptidase [Oceanibacterium hippocampi]SLN48410.1 Cytosol aminopeptidase [Oceanibacterium hippocampi]